METNEEEKYNKTKKSEEDKLRKKLKKHKQNIRTEEAKPDFENVYTNYLYHLKTTQDKYKTKYPDYNDKYLQEYKWRKNYYYQIHAYNTMMASLRLPNRLRTVGNSKSLEWYDFTDTSTVKDSFTSPPNASLKISTPAPSIKVDTVT